MKGAWSSETMGTYHITIGHQKAEKRDVKTSNLSSERNIFFSPVVAELHVGYATIPYKI
jgi:hypothetical protein